jgi:hypothetical protein
MIPNTLYQTFVNRDFEPTGLPDNYPKPYCLGQLFYIQRNTDQDAIVYEINLDVHGQLIMSDPIKIYWISFLDGQQIKTELNLIQKKLAYGYTFEVINYDLIEFKLVCHEKRFFLQKMSNDQYVVKTMICDQYHTLNNLFVYVEEFGVFPNVKFVEFYGFTEDLNTPVYFKLNLQN